MKYFSTFADQLIGALAQLVEQWTENPCVPGSIPGGTTYRKPFVLRRVFLWIFMNVLIYGAKSQLNQFIIYSFNKIIS